MGTGDVTIDQFVLTLALIWSLLVFAVGYVVGSLSRKQP